jgi:hypothetical protein
MPKLKHVVTCGTASTLHSNSTMGARSPLIGSQKHLLCGLGNLRAAASCGAVTTQLERIRRRQPSAQTTELTGNVVVGSLCTWFVKEGDSCGQIMILIGVGSKSRYIYDC